MIDKKALLNYLIKMADQFDRNDDEPSADMVEEIMKRVIALDQEELSPETMIPVDSDEEEDILAILQGLKEGFSDFQV